MLFIGYAFAVSVPHVRLSVCLICVQPTLYNFNLSHQQSEQTKSKLTLISIAHRHSLTHTHTLVQYQRPNRTLCACAQISSCIFMLLFDFLGNKPSVMFLGLKVQRCIVMEFMSEVIRDSLPKIVGLGEILRQTENVHVHFYADVGYN